MKMFSEWDSAARLRRTQIEQGKDLTFSKVFVPLYIDLISKLCPESVIEVGIGTGHLALELYQRCPLRYVGIEPSKGMFDEATGVLRNTSVEIVLSTLEHYSGAEKFQLLISHMCLHAVADVDAFCSSVEKVLAIDGAYLMAIPHPAFFNSYKKVIAENSYSYMTPRTAVIDFSITSDPTGIIKQVPYFHRPLSSYFQSLAKVGLAITFLKEVVPSESVQALYGSPWLTPRYLLMGGSRHSESLSRDGNSVAGRLLQCEIGSLGED